MRHRSGVLVLVALAAMTAEGVCAEKEQAMTGQKEETCVIEDATFIKATPERVYKALTDGAELGHWWPKSAESDPKVGGKLELTWFNGSKMKSAFTTLVPGKEVSYPFYTEKLTFTLTEKGNGTRLIVKHECGKEASIHIAQAWGFLKASLKVWIEHGIDIHGAE